MTTPSRLQERFRTQYRTLDEQTLRQIAEGRVPWVEQGHYLYAARLAARQLLEERGVADLPHVPAWDPSAESMPWAYRTFAIGLLLGIALLAAWALLILRPLGAPDVSEVCEVTAQRISQTRFAIRYQQRVSDCVVADSGEKWAVGYESCIEVSAGQLQYLSEHPNPSDFRRIQRYVAQPVAGEHCIHTTTLAEAVVRPGRPWFVQLTDPAMN